MKISPGRKDAAGKEVAEEKEKKRVPDQA